ncbi:Uncharacterized conserved protein, DUF1800 family [Nocardioides terrae]|uniref:Uncharacterized conserved protein, DUF1800 family n=1 Tax=Nocardioides terrae TaxID=574651 RepID=A0A1I1I5C1_9ACTN|nr:DUF1800 domain-containing protein [Nocardioides terrae]SFC29398.1 Uncharacterized conserved protein, DUF1800 family [Nocardioides terrae]
MPLPRSVPRRTALASGATAAALTGVLAGPAGRAVAAPSYAPGSYPLTPVLPTADRHLLSRFSYGITPGLRDEVRAAGGARAWFDAQLTAAHDPSDHLHLDWWPHLADDASQIWQNDKNKVRAGWQLMQDYGRRVLVRRILTTHQVREVMTEFWENLLHVPTPADGVFTWRIPYGERLRALALTSYAELLHHAVTHEAMTIFLSGYDSTKAHPNENLGRELLELFTVGVGSYDEDDVKASARILTGFHIDMWRTFGSSYQAGDHWTGPVRVLDFTSDNAAADGRAVVDAYVSYLARHRFTAERIARRLAVAFVSDDPPAPLVERLAAVYLEHDTAIVPVLRALVDSAEFASAVDAKLRTPAEDLVATYRLLGVELAKPTSDNSGANAIIWQAEALGQAPMAWPRPDGAPLVASAWASPSRVLASMSVHSNMGGGWWPKLDMTYPGYASWAPALPISFRDLVDHLSRLLHHRASDASLLEGACLALKITDPGVQVKAGSSVLGWQMPTLLATLLDHPRWYRR